MKKEDIGGLFVYMAIIALAVVFGFTVLQKHVGESSLSGFYYVLYILGAVVAGTIINSVVFELGHIAGAKLGKYEVLSVNILGLLFYKEEKKIKIRFASYDGLTGETKIAPKEEMVEKANPYPFLLCGTVFYAIEAVMIMIAFSFLKESRENGIKDVAYALLIIGAIGFAILLYNILPFKIDSTTDGYRLTTVGNPKNRVAFNELLRVEYLIEQGATDVEVKTFNHITNFTADLNLNKVYALLDEKKYQEAEVIVDKIVEAKNDVSEKVFIRARAQKIYIGLISKDLSEAKTYYDSEVPVSERREISNDISMACIRAYLLMSGLLDKSRSECLIALNNVYKALKRTPKARQIVEVKLFNEALQKVVEAHPDWELEEYKLNISQ